MTSDNAQNDKGICEHKVFQLDNMNLQWSTTHGLNRVQMWG